MRNTLFELNNHTKPTEAAQYSEEFQTPHDVAAYMVGLLPDGVSRVLEPTPGRGHIVTALRSKGYEVYAPSDYFLLDKTQRFDAIVMNPPFSTKYAFMENAPPVEGKRGMRLGYQILKECTELSDNVIALMPYFTISDSDLRLRYLIDYGLKSITALPRRTFEYARIQTVILELQKGYKNPTNI